jgi:hypothetical protein
VWEVELNYWHGSVNVSLQRVSLAGTGSGWHVLCGVSEE